VRSKDAIHIPHLLNLTDHTCRVDVEAHLPELETLTPVRGEVTVVHCGNYLDVGGHGETIVTLTCDRCLEHYNYRLQVTPRELIWLQPLEELVDTLPAEREVNTDDLVETLPPSGYFDPLVWLYEQFCLALPPQQFCSSNCRGIQTSSELQIDQPVDSRWAVLSQLKRQLDE